MDASHKATVLITALLNQLSALDKEYDAGRYSREECAYMFKDRDHYDKHEQKYIRETNILVETIRNLIGEYEDVMGDVKNAILCATGTGEEFLGEIKGVPELEIDETDDGESLMGEDREAIADYFQEVLSQLERILGRHSAGLSDPFVIDDRKETIPFLIYTELSLDTYSDVDSSVSNQPPEGVSPPSASDYQCMMEGQKLKVQYGDLGSPDMLQLVEIPELLLCHYSPFFEKYCSFKGLQVEQILTIPKSKTHLFEELIAYMYRGGPVCGKPPATRNPKEFNARSIELLDFADTFDLGWMAADIVHQGCRVIWGFGEHEEMIEIDGNTIEAIFRTTHYNNPLRYLAARAALKSSLARRNSGYTVYRQFKKQEIEVPGFANQLLEIMLRENGKNLRYDLDRLIKEKGSYERGDW